MNKKSKGISAATLKWIAIISMMIDHFGIAVYWQLNIHNYYVYKVMRDGIGRIAFPIYCFMLVEGFFHTGSVKKYIERCLIFAFVSEIPFNLAIYGKIFHFERQNVYFTMVLGIIAMSVLQKTLKYRDKKIVFVVLQSLCIAAYLGAGTVLKVDYYDKGGMMFIIVFYYFKIFEAYIEKKYQMLLGALLFAVVEPVAVLAFIPIWFYNGERGKQNKYLFYWIYPAHLFLFGITRIILSGQLFYMLNGY